MIVDNINMTESLRVLLVFPSLLLIKQYERYLEDIRDTGKEINKVIICSESE